MDMDFVKKKVLLRKLDRGLMMMKWIKTEIIEHEGYLDSDHTTDVCFRIDTTMHDLEDAIRAIRQETGG